MKRALGILLTLVLLLTSVSALGEIARVTDEKKEFTFWAAYNPNYQTDWEGIKAWSYFEEATGVHINWVLYANSGEMSEKLSVLIASADLAAFPDAFYRCGIGAAQLKKFGPEGLMLDIQDLVKQYAPNLCARLDQLNAWSAVLDPVTGAMYSCPELDGGMSTRMHPKLFFNQKMLDNMGAKMPTTTDELYDLLVRVRDEDVNGNGDKDDEIGITSNGLSNVLRMFTGAFGINNRGREDLSVDADPADPTKIRFVYTTNEYRQMLSYVGKLYQEKLIDQDLFALNTAKMVAKGSQEMIFGLSYINSAAASVVVEDYVGVDVALKGPEGYQQWNNMKKGVGLGSFVISAGCKDPETLIKWIDNFYSDEGSLLLYYGKEGVDFYYAEDGLPAYMPELLAQVSTDNPYDKVISAVTPYASGGIPSYYADEFYCGAESRGMALEAAKKLEPYVNNEVWLFNFTTEENEELSPLKTDLLSNCHDVYRAKFIMGELDINDDAVWDAYVKEMNDLGLDDYIAIYQTALDRMLAVK